MLLRRFGAMAAMGLFLVALAATCAVAQAQTGSWYKPKPLTTFHWQLSETPTLSVYPSAAVFDMDGFGTPAATIAEFKRRGKKVICYFSFGTREDWNPDAAKFPRSVLGGKVCMDTADDGRCTKWWQGERWLDVRSTAVRTTMESRIKLAKSKGCDGIEPDNIDAYNADVSSKQTQPITKFTITESDQLNYNTWIANTVHKYNMSVGLKNAPLYALRLVDRYDWALIEECNKYSDFSAGPWYEGKYQCDYANAFIAKGKAVFVAEYSEEWGPQLPKSVCRNNNANGFSTRLYNLDLAGPPLYPASDCLRHTTPSCATCWKTCILPANYKAFNKSQDMQYTDMIGQCVRKCAATSCPYV